MKKYNISLIAYKPEVATRTLLFIKQAVLRRDHIYHSWALDLVTLHLKCMNGTRLHLTATGNGICSAPLPKENDWKTKYYYWRLCSDQQLPHNGHISEVPTARTPGHQLVLQGKADTWHPLKYVLKNAGWDMVWMRLIFSQSCFDLHIWISLVTRDALLDNCCLLDGGC